MILKVFLGDKITKMKERIDKVPNPLGAVTPYKYELVGRLHSKPVPPLCYCVLALLTASEVHSTFFISIKGHLL